MININNCDLEDLIPLDNGSFGDVYQIDRDTCYKIYHSKIINVMGIFCDNPALSVPISKLERLKRRASSLVHTSTVKDLIYIDGKFGGVSIPYYDGRLLNEFISSPFKIKRDLSNQLIRNHIELNNHLIYPFDYKLNNVMVVNNEIKIIDLDDVFTMVPKFYLPHYSFLSNISLSKCIASLFGSKRKVPFSYDVTSNLNKNRNIKRTSSIISLELQLLLRDKPHNFSIISKNDDLSKIEMDKSSNILFLYEKNMSNNDILRVITKLKEKDLSLFDLLEREDLDDYFTNYNTLECSDIHGNSVYQKGR